MAKTAAQAANEQPDPPTTPPANEHADPPIEDITPRNTLPSMAQQHMPVKKPKAGWQSDPLPVEELTLPCPHIGRMAASLQVGQYELGAEWVCTCGQIFVVAYNAGDKRTLVKKEDVD